MRLKIFNIIMAKKGALLLVLMLTVSLSLMAQQAPSLRCLEITNNNSVPVYFIPPVGGDANFLNYQLYASPAEAGPYTMIHTADNFDSKSYVGIGNAAIHNFFFLGAMYDGDPTLYTSDTLNVINLSLAYSAGRANLTWNAPSDPLLPTTELWYRIERKAPTDVEYQIVGYSQTPSYSEPVEVVCEDTLLYQVYLADEYLLETVDTIKCYNTSAIRKERFENTISPAPPIFSRVSVNRETQKVNLHWIRSAETDVDSYIIFRDVTNTGATWPAIDTVEGRLTTFYEDNIHDAGTVNYYRIQAVDRCGIAPPSPMTDPQQNMVLNNDIDPCEATVDITWNRYDNIADGLEKYELLLSTNGGAWELLQTFTDINTTSYTFENALPNTEYTFLVQAVSTNHTDTAFSTKMLVNYAEEITNDLVEIKAVTVVENEFIDLHVSTTGDQWEFDELAIYRSVGSDDNFQLLIRIPYVANQVDYVYSDMSVEVDENLYFYRVDLIKPCNRAPAVSNIANNILLDGESNAAHVNTLQWYNYSESSTYAVYRINEIEPVPSIIEGGFAPSPGAVTLYTDDVSTLFSEGEIFEYEVEAENTVPPSRSNRIALRQDPTTYIPNAFRPVGNVENNVFRPLNSFVSVGTYSLHIYNRMGDLVFLSFDPYEGWDGTLNGADCPMGVYVYRMQYTYGTGEVFDKTSTVTLIR